MTKYTGLAEAEGADAGARRSLALAQRGAAEVLAHVTAHPRASVTSMVGLAGLSRSTVKRRLNELEDSGAVRNAGTAKNPLWQVAGVEHAPEELLTERQARILACLRRDPAPRTSEIAAELGASPTTVNNEYLVLASRGLARKAGRGRWVATGTAADSDATRADEALAHVRAHPDTTVSATAKAMGASRPTAREALLKLESEGLVARSPEGRWSATPGAAEGGAG